MITYDHAWSQQETCLFSATSKLIGVLGDGVVLIRNLSGTISQVVVNTPDEVVGPIPPMQIITAPDGNLWIQASNGSSQVLIFDRTGGFVALRLFGECFLAPNFARQDVWCAGLDGSGFGELPLASAMGSSFIVTHNGCGLAIAPDGAVWFGAGGAMDRMAPTTGMVTNSFPATAPCFPTFLGSDIWFTENAAGANTRIARMTSTGAVNEITVPSPPSSLTAGPDGFLWFVEGAVGRIGRVTPPTGPVVEFSIPIVNSGPSNLVYGADGNLWFLEAGGVKLGSITP